MSKVQVDSRYLVLAMEFPNQVTVPPPKPNSDACGGEKYACLVQRRRQSSARICVERANAELRLRACHEAGFAPTTRPAPPPLPLHFAFPRPREVH
ncbi:hypothetical protein [Streptomyces sp. NPDC019890]|uniref:hypothetical protein n=1 Tax=Streptomyces sp. NPDC019890 TaxID=3365064 RepID=UPI00384D06C0